MKRANPYRDAHHRQNIFGCIIFSIVLCAWLGGAQVVEAAAWHNIEPLKSRRADVERELGKPVVDAVDGSGALHFKVTGGTVTVTFVSAKFVATKKLAPDYEGTVLEIVLQHDNATDTPESLGLTTNSDFDHNANGQVTVYQNLKDGIAYTFVNGHLRTTRYAAATEQLLHAQRE